MEAKEILECFEELVSKEATDIIKIVNGDKCHRAKLIDMPLVMDYEMKSRNKLRGKHGLYVIRVEEACTLSPECVSSWNSVAGAGFFQVEQKLVNDGDVLYLGSCVSKSLYSRVGEHYAVEGTFTALKLSNPKRCCMRDKVTFWAFPIKKEFESYSRLILPAIEKQLHSGLLPLCGSSRI